jgi:hypothetical protein
VLEEEIVVSSRLFDNTCFESGTHTIAANARAHRIGCAPRTSSKGGFPSRGTSDRAALNSCDGKNRPVRGNEDKSPHRQADMESKLRCVLLLLVFTKFDFFAKIS